MILPDKIRFAVITLSDRASRGEYEDLSGPAITAMIREFFAEKSINAEIENVIIPDDPKRLSGLLLNYRAKGTEVVFTTGGTGLGPRDFTPDVVKPLLDKEIPGVMEMIRVKYGMIKPVALVSRSIAGVSGKTLVYCLPGSLKAVGEYCHEILPTIMHSIKMVLGIDDHNC
ncbi:MAG: MogA/MoaB family molybdenum cofactor biosynthesis protein [Porphyromonadaceae bacterium]|nr:MAG: MogA/MoaB family molybdenum cofactor biosynthesis protein [Porphyromonadaceae bacterium]